MNIVLIGYRGSGKFTVGRLLAVRLHMPLVCLDEEIVKKAGKRIIDIFTSEGEQVFRALERASLREIAGESHHVISLGGGTIADEENFRLIRESGIVVYLKLSPEEILHRVHHRTDRPLLTGAGGVKLPMSAESGVPGLSRQGRAREVRCAWREVRVA